MKYAIFITFIAATSFVARAHAYNLMRVQSDSTGLEEAGLKNRGRCEIGEKEKVLVTITDGNALREISNIVHSDPRIKQAKSKIAEFANTVKGVKEPEFPQGIPTTNYWVENTGEEAQTPRRLLKSIQGGKVVAEDNSVEARTLVRFLERNCR